MKSAKRSEVLEEKWNVYSHGVGIPMTLLGLFILVGKATSDSFVPVLIFGLSLVLLYTASTAYHWATDTNTKRRLRILDHISIYYLIAGTYTPVCLLVLQNSKGIILLWLVWGLAVFGTFLKLFFTGRYEAFSLFLYALMGWLVVLDLPYLLQHMDGTALVFLGLGGMCYTFGIFFYAFKKIPFNHVIWHVFVLMGSLFHWLSIFYII